ncbi:MAG: hypothetical protein A2144_04355 [Chloroflexi bacterium RBG_16_50_9]|nr:MAG: hypothetical protein A2144_04355 [Chloroflexi bacterium RBG_16_50_9]
MKREEISIKVILVVLLLVLFSSLILIGCGNYKIFMFDNNIANCEFEYPASYVVGDIIRGDFSTIAFALFTYKQVESSTNWSTAYISISGRQKDVSFPDYHALLEYNLKNAQQQYSIYGFNLVERSPLSIENVLGEKIIYNYINPWDSEIIEDEIVKMGPISGIAYEAYFENDGFLWTILFHATAQISAQAKADFEHILQTFKFLN